MKYAFTTLGCPDWDLETIIQAAAEIGYHAIDFRGYKGQMAIWETPEFGAQIQETARKIGDAGLQVSCISTGVKCMAGGAGNADEVARSAEAAAALGAGQLRVFGGAYDESALDRDTATKTLAGVLCDLASRANAVADLDVLLETHDAWTESPHVVAAVRGSDSRRVGVCWDVKHTYWVAEETPFATWRQIGPWVRNTHWKDVRRGEEGRSDRLCLVGDGQLPLADAYQVLSAAGYDGHLTLEWEKGWHPEIEDPELAFAAFITVAGSLEEWRARVREADAAEQ